MMEEEKFFPALKLFPHSNMQNLQQTERHECLLLIHKCINAVPGETSRFEVCTHEKFGKFYIKVLYISYINKYLERIFWILLFYFNLEPKTYQGIMINRVLDKTTRLKLV